MAPKGVSDELAKAAADAGASEEDIEGSTAPDESPKEPEGSDQPAGDGAELSLEDLPETFFGENIHEYAQEHGVEAAKVYVDALKDADRVVNSKLQAVAEARKKAEEAAAAAVPEPPPVEEQKQLSDEELLESHGYDPDLLNFEGVGKPIVDMLREQISLKEQLGRMDEDRAYSQWESQFFGRLDQLQQEKGALPYDRATLETIAGERKIFDADALYYAIKGPVMDEAKSKTRKKSDALEEVKKAIGAKGTKRGGAPGKTTDVTKGISLLDSYKAAKAELKVEGDPFRFPEA